MFIQNIIYPISTTTIIYFIRQSTNKRKVLSDLNSSDNVQPKKRRKNDNELINDNMSFESSVKENNESAVCTL